VAAWERPKLDPDGGVISYQSAARLQGLGDLPNTRVEITVPRRRTTRDSGVRLQTGELNDSEVALLDGLPVTTPLRTICDLLDRRTDASHIATIIRQATEAGQVQLDELSREIQPYARHYGVKPENGAELLDHLLAQIGASGTDLAAGQSGRTRAEMGTPAWADLRDTNVTWGQLANLAPEIVQRLRHAAEERHRDAEPNDEK
jgi:hypothetical protein